MKKRIADIIAETLADSGIEDVFMITGGGAMHLNDGLGRCKRLKITFNHNEQASAIAAEAYCRFSGRLAALNVTSGPGGINALNGVYGAYVDSIGMIVVSGQIKRETMARNYAIPLRQLGDQEVDIISIVKPITKYATVLQNPKDVKAVLQKALYLAQNGRPGPVWIDVPLDIQGAVVEENDLPDWSMKENGAIEILRGDSDITPNTLSDFTLAKEKEITDAIDIIFDRLNSAQRPVLFGGTGVRVSGCTNMFRELASNLNIPVVTGWNAHDLIPNSHICYAGRPGTVGDRPGNFSVQNSDFLLTLGCRLNIRQISYGWKNFANKAWKAQIDIDSSELRKPTLNNDLSLQADLRNVMPLLLEKSRKWKINEAHVKYLDWCKERVVKYPVLQHKHIESDKVNPYYFMDRLFEKLDSNEVIVAANGSACVIGFQTARIKENTRLFTNSGDASMGYDLPAAIGVAATGGTKRVICLAGDGSIMMNLQELQTIAGNNLPIIVFVLDNNGYASIRQTQKAYFPDNLLGIGPSTGVTFPNFINLANSFGIETRTIAHTTEITSMLDQILSNKGPLLCHVLLDEEQSFEPKLASRKLPDGTMLSPTLEDMFPFLPREELEINRIK